MKEEHTHCSTNKKESYHNHGRKGNVHEQDFQTILPYIKLFHLFYLLFTLFTVMERTNRLPEKYCVNCIDCTTGIPRNEIRSTEAIICSRTKSNCLYFTQTGSNTGLISYLASSMQNTWEKSNAWDIILVEGPSSQVNGTWHNIEKLHIDYWMPKLLNDKWRCRFRKKSCHWWLSTDKNMSIILLTAHQISLEDMFLPNNQCIKQ